jgi:hypothetical protein
VREAERSACDYEPPPEYFRISYEAQILDMRTCLRG